MDSPGPDLRFSDQLKRLTWIYQGQIRHACFEVGDHDPRPVPCEEAKPAPPRPEPGLGDAVAAATKAVGVRPCGGCARRQEALNRATPSWARKMLGRLGVGGSRPGRFPGSAPP